MKLHAKEKIHFPAISMKNQYWNISWTCFQMYLRLCSTGRTMCNDRGFDHAELSRFWSYLLAVSLASVSQSHRQKQETEEVRSLPNQSITQTLTQSLTKTNTRLTTNETCFIGKQASINCSPRATELTGLSLSLLGQGKRWWNLRRDQGSRMVWTDQFRRCRFLAESRKLALDGGELRGNTSPSEADRH